VRPFFVDTHCGPVAPGGKPRQHGPILCLRFLRPIEGRYTIAKAAFFRGAVSDSRFDFEREGEALRWLKIGFTGGIASPKPKRNWPFISPLWGGTGP